MENKAGLDSHDLAVLREFGEWQARTAASAENQEKIAAWQQHDAGVPGSRVMVIAETWYTTDAVRTVNPGDLRCVDPWARSIEWAFLQRRFEADVLRDDRIVSPYIEYEPVVHISDFGVPSGVHRDANASSIGFNYQPPLEKLDDADFARIHHREFRWDREAEERQRDRLTAVFDGILPVRRRNGPWQVCMPVTNPALSLVGLDGFMTLLYDNPAGLHRLLAFIRDDHLAYLQFFEEHRLLSLNSEADYIGSGCVGCSRQLPAADYTGTVRPRDRWHFCESQESVGISPAQYGEFVFPHVRAIAEKFGRVYYGCCEPVDPVWEHVRTLPNLRRVSVSPWANEEKMGRFCREAGVVYSRKPSPNLFMGDRYDEGAARAHLEKTVGCTTGVRLELIQRDVITLNNEPSRFVRWVELAREVSRAHQG